MNHPTYSADIRYRYDEEHDEFIYTLEVRTQDDDFEKHGLFGINLLGMAWTAAEKEIDLGRPH